MGALIVELVPFAIGLVVTPAAIVAVILFLGSRRPVADATAFTVAFGAVYGLVCAGALVASVSAGGPLVSLAVKGAISLLVGILLAAAGLAEILLRPRPDAVRPHWMTSIVSASPSRASALGAGLALANPNLAILLAGLTAIVATALAVPDQVLAAAFLLLASVIALAAPIVAYALAPRRLAGALAAVQDWLVRNQRVVNIVVFLGFGVLFVVRGLSDL